MQPLLFRRPVTHVSVDIIEINHAPLLTAPQTLSVEGASGTFAAQQTGHLNSVDADIQDEVHYSLQGAMTLGVAHALDGLSYDLMKEGHYGVLYLNSQSGAYVYVTDPARVQALATLETVQEAYQVVATDSRGASVAQTLQVRVMGSNDAPKLDILGQTYTEASGWQNLLIPQQWAATDSDSALWQSVDVQIQDVQAHEALQWAGSSLTAALLKADYDSTTGLLTLRAIQGPAASQAVFIQAMAEVQYRNTSSAPSPVKALTWRVTDDDGQQAMDDEQSTTVVQTLTLQALDNAPVVSGASAPMALVTGLAAVGAAQGGGSGVGWHSVASDRCG